MTTLVTQVAKCFRNLHGTWRGLSRVIKESMALVLANQLATLVDRQAQYASNVLGEEIITTGRCDNQVLSYIDTGSRWALGGRATF